MIAPVLTLLSVIVSAWAGQPLDVYWNISNPIFSGGFGADYQNIIEVNKDTHPYEYDQVNIICPSGINTTERHIIYSVEKEEFDTCTIIKPNPRIIAVCDQPRNLMYFTITFRSFSPSPQQMEFKPGQSYYFISTSSHRDMQRTVGGWCRTKNMKMIFRVAENPHERAVEVPPRSHPWAKLWPTARDSYHRPDNRLRTKSLRNNRLDPRHVRLQSEELERFDGSNALKLQSSCDSFRSIPALVFLSLATYLVRL